MILGLRGLILGLKAGFRLGRADFKFWRAGLRPETGNFRPEKTDLKLRRIEFRPQSAGLNLGRGGGGGERGTRYVYDCMYICNGSPQRSVGHWLIRAAALKG